MSHDQLEDLSEAAAAVLAQFPGPVILRPRKSKWLFVLATFAMMIAVGAWNLLIFVRAGGVVHVIGGGILLIVGGVCAGLLMRVLVKGSMQMKLDAEAFEIHDTWSILRRRWRDADGFVPVWIMMYGAVAYNDLTRPTNALDRWVLGRNARLFDTYGLKTTDLANLMTQWRDRVVSHGHGP